MLEPNIEQHTGASISWEILRATDFDERDKPHIQTDKKSHIRASILEQESIRWPIKLATKKKLIFHT